MGIYYVLSISIMLNVALTVIILSGLRPKIVPKELYRHFKGDVYELITLARFHESPQIEVVVYRHVQSGAVWYRDTKEFFGIHPINNIRRFTRL